MPASCSSFWGVKPMAAAAPPGLIRRTGDEDARNTAMQRTGMQRPTLATPCLDPGHGPVSHFGANPCLKNGDSRVSKWDTNPVREPLSKPVKEGVMAESGVWAV